MIKIINNRHFLMLSEGKLFLCERHCIEMHQLFGYHDIQSFDVGFSDDKKVMYLTYVNQNGYYHSHDIDIAYINWNTIRINFDTVVPKDWYIKNIKPVLEEQFKFIDTLTLDSNGKGLKMYVPTDLQFLIEQSNYEEAIRSLLFNSFRIKRVSYND